MPLLCCRTSSVTTFILLMHFSAAVPSTFESFGFPRGMSEGGTLSEWARSRQFERDPRDWQGINHQGPASRQVLMINGTAEDVISFFFIPEVGTTTDDYNFIILSNNSEIVDPGVDVSMARTGSKAGLNVTSAIDFNKFPGKVAITLEARRKSDGTMFASESIDYLAAGLAVFTSDARKLISGAGRSFTIPSYEDVYKKSHWEFDAFVQYLNGTDSSQNPELTFKSPSTSSLFALSDITATFLSNNGQLLWEPSACTIADGIWDGSKLSLKSGCSVGFAMGLVNDSYYDGFHFGYDFEKNRAGRIDIFFEWDQFTADTEFEDELFTTYVLAEILGQPPVTVRRIEPGNPFSKFGGEQVYVELINTDDVNLTALSVNDVYFDLVPGSRQFFRGPTDFYETATFLTKPGTGKRLQWSIVGFRSPSSSGAVERELVSFQDETGFLFSYDDDNIDVDSVTPSTVSEFGGGSAAISGNFTTFEANDPSHNVIIGNNVLDRKYLHNATEEALTFEVPPRVEIGSAWEFDVVVQVGNTYSAPLTLNYEPSSLSVSQQTFGTSLDESGVHTLSSCGQTTFMVTLQEYNGAEGSYMWRLLSSSAENLLSFENASSLLKTESSFVLPNEFIPHFDTLFKVVADIVVGSISTSSVFQVKKTQGFVVGVTIVQPEVRMMSSPAVSARVVAKIEVPDCYQEAVSLVYEWEYEDKVRTLLEAERVGVMPVSVHDSALKPYFEKFVFSYENTTTITDGSITPTRLGRELVIPRGKLRHGLHRIRLSVRAENSSLLIGSAGTSMSIVESPLRAVIGIGEVFRRTSDAEDLFLSGQGSTDPDVVPPGIPSRGLSFLWSCRLSLFPNISSSQPCWKSLMPPKHLNSSIFTVASESLQNITKLSQKEEEGQVYLQYTLVVRKNDREGSASQTVAVVKANGRKRAAFQRIEMLNSRGEEVNPHAVEFWEDVIIRPKSVSNAEWRFRLEEPLSEKSQFFGGNAKTIERPGYYSTMGSSDPGYQRLPLGIKANKLTPHQKYVISVSFQEPGKITDEVMLHFKTVEVPSLIFPRIPFSNGTVNSTFRATATTAFHGNSCYTFQFYVLEVGKHGHEYCVDGCTGANTVRFQIAKPGTYVFQCRMLVASGKTLLAVKNNTALISIAPSVSASNVEHFDLDMDRDYLLGDDGSVNQKGFFVTESMHEQDGQVVSMADDSGSEMCANYTKKWVKMSREIVGKDMPNTANARNYIILASNFARLKCVEDLQTLYELLGIVEQSIARTPQEEVLTTSSYSDEGDMPNVQLEDEVLRFYNFSMTRAFSHLAAGSSRGRMNPVTGEVNNLVLDLAEMWIRHITTTATSGRVCGWDGTYSSNSDDGEPDRSLTQSGAEPSLGVNTIKVAVRCNAEQGTSLSTPYASFQWCDTIYDLAASERMLVTLAESYDYPFLSGIQGMNKSDSRRLVMVDITTLGESNQLVSAMSDSMVFAQAESEEADAENCYQIRLTMGTEAMTRSDECSENVPYHMWPRKAYGDQLIEPYQNSAYERRTLGVKTSPETRNDSTFVIAQSNILGLYGASRTTCDRFNFGLEGFGISVAAILLGVLLTVVLISVLTYLLASTMVSRAAGADDYSIMVESYVERDFFGRGQVRLNLALHDDDALTDASSEGSSFSAIPIGPEDGNALEELDSIVPNHDLLISTTQSDIPEFRPK